MEIYVVVYGGYHDDCADNWANLTEENVEGVFESLEKAKEFIKNDYEKNYKDNEDDCPYFDEEYCYVLKCTLNSKELETVYSFSFTTGKEEL